MVKALVVSLVECIHFATDIIDILLKGGVAQSCMIVTDTPVF